MKLSKLNPNARNPRTISPEKLTALEKSVEEFGDMAGIVYNRRTKRLVGGHQRSKVLREAEIEIVHKQKADNQGTVATGYAIVRGQRYAYREVDWDKQKETAAMIAANAHGGEWSDGLADLLRELDSTELTGFDESELAGILKTVKPVQLKKLDTKPAPEMAWVLIAVPLEKYGRIDTLIRKATEIEGALVQTTTTDFRG